MKVVFDSNIYISAYCFDKDPERLINLGAAGLFKVFSSLYIIEEVTRVSEKLGMTARFTALAAKRIEKFTNVVPVRGPLSKVMFSYQMPDR